MQAADSRLDPHKIRAPLDAGGRGEAYRIYGM